MEAKKLPKDVKFRVGSWSWSREPEPAPEICSHENRARSHCFGSSGRWLPRLGENNFSLKCAISLYLCVLSKIYKGVNVFPIKFSFKSIFISIIFASAHLLYYLHHFQTYIRRCKSLGEFVFLGAHPEIMKIMRVGWCKNYGNISTSKKILLRTN